MAVSQDLADRVRAVLAPRAPFEERTMFGGLAFLVDGRMAVAITGDALMVGSARADAPPPWRTVPGR